MAQHTKNQLYIGKTVQQCNKNLKYNPRICQQTKGIKKTDEVSSQHTNRIFDFSLDFFVIV